MCCDVELYTFAPGSELVKPGGKRSESINLPFSVTLLQTTSRSFDVLVGTESEQY